MPLGSFKAQDQLEIASLGTEFALTEIIGAALGYWLDQKLGSLPWCLVAGVVIGFSLGLFRVIQVARAADKTLKKAAKNGRS